MTVLQIRLRALIDRLCHETLVRLGDRTRAGEVLPTVPMAVGSRCDLNDPSTITNRRLER